MPVVDSSYSAQYYAGAGGAVFSGGVLLSFVKEWSLEVSLDVYGADTFDNPTNANGVIFKRKDLLGMAEGKVDLSGYDIIGGTGITVGSIYTLALRRKKSLPGSTTTVIAVCNSVSYKQAADGNNPVEFSASFTIHGPVEV